MLAWYRAAGAEPPFGDPSRYRGAGIEGYFWRLTDAPTRRVVIVLAAVSRVRGSEPWGLVALAAEPGGLVRSGSAPRAHGDPRGPGLRVGELLRADAESLQVDLGDAAQLDVRLLDGVRWRGALGAMGVAQLAPVLSQYWHPHLLRAQVRGEARLGGERVVLDAATAYAEKNWGPAAMPALWWWGEAHDFAGAALTVAFAGGPARWGPLRTTGTALAIAWGDEQLRFVRPLVPMRVSADGGEWMIRARTARLAVELEAGASPQRPPLLLPVPVLGERRHVDGVSPQHLAGTLRLRLRRGRRLLLDEQSSLAGLELGRGLHASAAP